MKNILIITLFAAGLLFGSATVQEVSAQETTSGQVTLTEYSDYQCPACAAYHPVVEKLKEDFGDKLKVEYRYFPLNSHQFAFLAARAAEAARNQGKFLEMHDMLFDNQQRWSRSGNPQAQFISYAREIGLDVEQFKNELNAAKTQKNVVEEKKEGQRLGVNSTPTFFVNGEKIERNPQSYEAFRQLIEERLEATGG